MIPQPVAHPGAGEHFETPSRTRHTVEALRHGPLLLTKVVAKIGLRIPTAAFGDHGHISQASTQQDMSRSHHSAPRLRNMTAVSRRLIFGRSCWP